MRAPGSLPVARLVWTRTSRPPERRRRPPRSCIRGKQLSCLRYRVPCDTAQGRGTGDAGGALLLSPVDPVVRPRDELRASTTRGARTLASSGLPAGTRCEKPANAGYQSQGASLAAQTRPPTDVSRADAQSGRSRARTSVAVGSDRQHDLRAVDDVRRSRHHAGPAQANRNAVITLPIHDTNATKNAPDSAARRLPAERPDHRPRSASWGRPGGSRRVHSGLSGPVGSRPVHGVEPRRDLSGHLTFDGKEGVDGSSPSEGSREAAGNSGFLVPGGADAASVSARGPHMGHVRSKYRKDVAN
jgi:hypothetical protein